MSFHRRRLPSKGVKHHDVPSMEPQTKVSVIEEKAKEHEKQTKKYLSLARESRQEWNRVPRAHIMKPKRITVEKKHKTKRPTIDKKHKMLEKKKEKKNARVSSHGEITLCEIRLRQHDHKLLLVKWLDEQDESYVVQALRSLVFDSPIWLDKGKPGPRNPAIGKIIAAWVGTTQKRRFKERIRARSNKPLQKKGRSLAMSSIQQSFKGGSFSVVQQPLRDAILHGKESALHGGTAVDDHDMQSDDEDEDSSSDL